MAKQQTIYYCTECGNESHSYLGKCPFCNTWGSLKEAKFDKTSKKSISKTKQEDGSLFIQAEAWHQKASL